MKSPASALLLALLLCAAVAPFRIVAASSDTIASVASGVPDLSTLVAAVKAAPSILKAATDADTQVTLFAPTNKAFEILLATLHISADKLLGNEKLLTAILKYHIVPKVIPSSEIKGLKVVDTLLAKASLYIYRIKDYIKVNEATVVKADVKAGKTVVHVIDKVLIPHILYVKIAELYHG